MKSSKNIKVYGTLVNHTLDSTLADETHNDALMNAYQLFDGRFGDSPLPNNFQDVINKRITDITFDGGTTTIENRDEVTENHYTLVVNGDTNLNGDVHITEDLHVDGDTYVDGDTHIDGDLYVTGDISGITLGDLDNVNKNADSASAGTFLKYNGSEWLPASIALSDTFGNIGNPFEGAILKYKNGAWTLTTDDDTDTDTDTNRINNMLDVNTSGITNGSVLKWNSSTNKWEMGADAFGSVLPQGTEGKVLKYINGSWVAADDLVGATKMSELSDVDTTGIAVGKILKWNGTKWTIGTDETGGGGTSGATKLSELSDVDSSVDNPTVGQVLYYNGSTWVSRKLSLSDIQMPNASEGQVLKYINGQWIAAKDEIGEGGDVSTTTYTFTFRKICRQLVNVSFDVFGADIYTANSETDTSTILYPKSNYCYVYLSDEYTDIDDSKITATEVVEFGNMEFKAKYYPSGVSKTNVANNAVSASGDAVANNHYSSSRLNYPTYVITPSTTNNVTPIEKTVSPYLVNATTTTVGSTEKHYVSAAENIIHGVDTFLESSINSSSGYSDFTPLVNTTISPEGSPIGEWYSLLNQTAIDNGGWYSRYIKFVNSSTNGNPNITATTITKELWLSKFPSFTPINAKLRIFTTQPLSNSMPDTITVKITVQND